MKRGSDIVAAEFYKLREGTVTTRRYLRVVEISKRPARYEVQVCDPAPFLDRGEEPEILGFTETGGTNAKGRALLQLLAAEMVLEALGYEHEERK